MKEDEIQFIARHYRKESFRADRAWRRLGISAASRWRRLRIAASVAAVIGISATATVLVHSYFAGESKEAAAPAQSVATLEAVRSIDFESTPLPSVIERIEEVYGVRVRNIPQQPEEYTLSLHYEGNAAELIAAINEILDTEMTVEEQ